VQVGKEEVGGVGRFFFHMLRHTFTSNLLSGGSTPKEVQELLGHTDVSTTMNIYAHATNEAKSSSAKLLDKVTVMGKILIGSKKFPSFLFIREKTSENTSG